MNNFITFIIALLSCAFIYCLALLEDNFFEPRRDNKLISYQYPWIIQICSIILLFIALFPIKDYNFYKLIRYYISVISIYIIWKALFDDGARGARAEPSSAKSVYTIIAVTTLIVYNPLIPLYLNKKIWQVINIATIAFIIGSIYVLRAKMEFLPSRVYKIIQLKGISTVLNEIEINHIDINKDIIAKRRDESTIMHVIAIDLQFNYDILESLILAGADINKQDQRGNTPLHIAIESNNVNFIKRLINFDADLMIKNNSGLRPLDLAKETKASQAIIDLIK